MTTVPYPYNNLRLDISRAYVNSLLKPYGEALFAVNPADEEDAIEALRQWSLVLLPGRNGNELVSDINNVISEFERSNQARALNQNFPPDNRKYYDLLISKIKAKILEFLGDLLVSYVKDRAVLPGQIAALIVTPWDLAKYRNEELTRLFGQSMNELNISVIDRSKNFFQHSLGEEIVYGILVGLEGRKDFKLLFLNNTLKLEDFTAKYSYAHSKYNVITNTNLYPFMTPDFIQGINTAALWLGVDPHTIIRTLKDRDGHILTF